MPAALNTTEDPDQDAPPPQNGEKQPMRKLKLSGAEPTAGGVKLSMRKLSFDSHVARLSQEQAKTLDEASANGSAVALACWKHSPTHRGRFSGRCSRCVRAISTAVCEMSTPLALKSASHIICTSNP